jgi:hypothetical protein
MFLQLIVKNDQPTFRQKSVKPIEVHSLPIVCHVVDEVLPVSTAVASVFVGGGVTDVSARTSVELGEERRKWVSNQNDDSLK